MSSVLCESNLVKEIVRTFVDNPDQVSIVTTKLDTHTVLELSVADEDRGKVIGKSGRTADAIRLLLSLACRKTGRRHNLEIVDPSNTGR